MFSGTVRCLGLIQPVPSLLHFQISLHHSPIARGDLGQKSVTLILTGYKRHFESTFLTRKNDMLMRSPCYFFFFLLLLLLLLSLVPQPSLGHGLLHKIRLNFLEASQQFPFLQGRVVSPTPNPHPRGPCLCIYIPKRQGGYPF
jgi:hypothetical protein